jgi:hypothetical protein
MPDVPQIWALPHQRCQLLVGCVGGAVIDVDDFVAPALTQRRNDLSDQRRNISRLVADRHNDGNFDGIGFG